MEIEFQATPSLRIKATTNSGVKGVFKFLADVGQILGHKRCGHCESEDLAPTYRKTKEGYEYFSIRCNDCRHEFKFGIVNDANAGFPLYPKWKDGWVPPYNKEDAETNQDRGGEDEYQQDDPPPQRRQRQTAGAGTAHDDIDF